MQKKTVAPPLYYRAIYLTKIENISQRIYTAIKTYEIDVFKPIKGWLKFASAVQLTTSVTNQYMHILSWVIFKALVRGSSIKRRNLTSQNSIYTCDIY